MYEAGAADWIPPRFGGDKIVTAADRARRSDGPHAACGNRKQRECDEQRCMSRNSSHVSQ
jgi:hypothetical protein